MSISCDNNLLRRCNIYFDSWCIQPPRTVADDWRCAMLKCIYKQEMHRLGLLLNEAEGVRESLDGMNAGIDDRKNQVGPLNPSIFNKNV